MRTDSKLNAYYIDKCYYIYYMAKFIHICPSVHSEVGHVSLNGKEGRKMTLSLFIFIKLRTYGEGTTLKLAQRKVAF